ncbi:MULTISPECIES: hypothetical protein [unclassified Streptomyces]|uniref:hypothetical protein n=1 Tax=unclassified Streptomyces TaxID=2593676 RepID=UPI000BAC8C5C|nr:MULTISPECIES: hypothetical protein [unclassified Streptomyces]ASY36995.1 hypothetical protein CAC01_30620 [Streptomyces sp. CLI2509]MYX19765.1 hypothetical protein [Streptomyces sp. SID8380]
MPVTLLTSAKSCGVTTAALALTLASARASVLVEADPAGGTIRTGLLQGQVDAGHGIYHLATAHRVGQEALTHAFASHLVPLDDAGHRQLLPGITDPGQAAALDRTWGPLGEILQVLADDDPGYDVLVDAGRLTLDTRRLHPTLTPAPLLYAADFVLLVVRGTDQSLTLAHHVIEPLKADLGEHGSGALGLLLIEEGPHGAHQVGEALGVPVVGALPWDTDTAAYLTGGGKPRRGLSRAPLLRGARTAGGHVEALAARRRLALDFPAQPEKTTRLGSVLHRLTQPGGLRG